MHKHNIPSKTDVQHSGMRQRERSFTYTVAGDLLGRVFLGRLLEMENNDLVTKTTVAMLGTGTSKPLFGSLCSWQSKIIPI